MLRAEATADLGWIHPTWLIRALQDESPTVRAVVAAHGPPIVRRALLASGVAADFDHDPHPEALAWVSALWTERLVGGAVRSRRPAGDRRAHEALPSRGLSPLACRGAGQNPARGGSGRRPTSAGRGGPRPWIFERLGPPPPETQSWARRDLDMVQKAQSERPPPHRAARSAHLGPPARRLRAVPGAMGAPAFALPDRQAGPLAHALGLETRDGGLAAGDAHPADRMGPTRPGKSDHDAVPGST